MSQAAIILNVSNTEHSHANGLSGIWTVPGRKEKETFGMLVIYPTPEIQDIGDKRRTIHWLKAKPLAMDVVGMRSDATAHTFGSTGAKEKWGLLLCAAEPDVPKELLTAEEAQIEFLNENPPDVKMRKDRKTGATVAVNIEPDAVREKKIELSFAVEALRHSFEAECRKLVQKAEIQRALRNLQVEDQRLVGEGDRIWARPEEQKNLSDLHRAACARLGQGRPWAYVPKQLVECPGCGAMIAENILKCPQCNGWLDEGIEELRTLGPKDRARFMYPERFEEPVAAGKR